MSDEVTLEYRGKLAIITLNVPKKLNALTQALYYQIAKNLREIAARDDVYITLLRANGTYFSAGADVTVSRETPPGSDEFHQYLHSFVTNNLNTTHAFYSHPKILITALNGPVLGLTAALVSFSDFIYAMPHTFLLTPFSSIGLVSEGNASIALVERLGLSKANEALIMSKRISCEELAATGYVNKVFDLPKGETDKFHELVFQEIEDRLGPHLVPESLIKIKALIRKPQRAALDAQGVAEVFGGLDRFLAGVPQEEFRKLASGEKRHKL